MDQGPIPGQPHFFRDRDRARDRDRILFAELFHGFRFSVTGTGSATVITLKAHRNKIFFILL